LPEEIAASRIVPRPSGFVAIEMEFTRSRKRVSELRIVSRAKPDAMTDLCRILGLDDSLSYRGVDGK
jgi:hypothetical protein